MPIDRGELSCESDCNESDLTLRPAPPRDTRPAALFIAPIMPADRGNGLAMRSWFLLNAYAQRFDVDLAVVPIAGQTGGAIGSFPTGQIRKSIVVPVMARNTHFTLLSHLIDPKARLAAFRDYASPSLGAFLTSTVSSTLEAFASERPYSLIHISRLYLATLARPWIEGRHVRKPTLILDSDEDDASAYRRLAQLYRKSGREEQADWAEAEACAFAKLAFEWLDRFDLVLASSSDEARSLSRRGRAVSVEAVPNVAPAKCRERGPRYPNGSRTIIFVGNMSYPPNIDAASWFARYIFPQLRDTFPFRVQFVIAGDNPAREVSSLTRQQGVIVTGGCDPIAPFYLSASLAVVPIRAGGGTRIKLLEAAAYGVPVVSTQFGASGTGFKSGRELLLADNAREFATSCARLLQDFGLASRLVAGARRKIKRDFDGGKCSRHFLAKIERLSPGE
jgi:polysaccharide biosynthesis protein PslH